MISLTRLNGHQMLVNCDLIKYAESAPDTMLTLINGEKIVVLESCEDVVNRVAAYRARLMTEALKAAPNLASALARAAATQALSAEEAVRSIDSPEPDMSVVHRRRANPPVR